MKYKITAVIPTVQYGNLQPSIEVEADTFEEAHSQAMPHIQRVWDMYGEKPLVSKSGARVKLQAFVGGEIFYDDLNHTYTNEAGEVYLSGSQYAKQFEKPFDGTMISGKMAAKYGVEASDIVKMWELKAKTSREFGTAIHSALELYGRYNGLATQLEKDTHVHDHPVIKKAVESFYEGRATETAELEVLVVDHASKRAGRIDRLLIVDRNAKVCRVQDFKTNATIEKSLPIYEKQLSFYGDILKANGWTVQGRDIFHWNGQWKTL